MYSINIEPQHTRQPPIRRKLSTNLPIELIPVIVEMCRSEYKMVIPVALYMGNNSYRIFDICKPSVYVNVHFIKDAN